MTIRYTDNIEILFINIIIREKYGPPYNKCPLELLCINSFEKKVNAKTVGNPIRNEIISIEQPKERLDGRDFPIRILILGGSQGSLVLNKSVPNSIKEIASIAKLEVLHQAGSKTIKEAQKSYENVPVGLYLVEFIDEIADAYQWADFAICRSGALTVAELNAVGLGALLIPFPFAIDDHQTTNGQWLVNAQAALMIQQRDITAQKLADHIISLGNNPEQRLIMANNARSLAKNDAAKRVSEVCMEVASV